MAQSYFNNDGAQLCLILQLLHYTLKRQDDSEKIESWKCKAYSAEKITSLTTTYNNLSPSIKRYKNSILFNV